MTHIFETTTNECNLIDSSKKSFDILKFGRTVSIGDTIIYQRLADTEEEETKYGKINETAFSNDEVSATIDYIYEDTEGALKKGFVAIGFSINKMQSN